MELEPGLVIATILASGISVCFLGVLFAIACFLKDKNSEKKRRKCTTLKK